MSFVMSTRELEGAVNYYVAATGKDMARAINRAIRNVGYKTAEETPQKDPEAIDKELRKDRIGLKFITKRLRGRIGTSYTTAKGRKRTVRRVTKKQIALRTRQFFGRRKKRRGFLRAGWIQALAAAGFPVRGLNGRISDSKSKGRLGSGQQATARKLRAYLGNAVWGRLTGKGAAKTRLMLQRALAAGMKRAGDDMRAFATEELAKSSRKYSAKKGNLETARAQLARMLRP